MIMSRFVGESWTDRFYNARNDPLCDEFYQPERVGPVKKGDDLDERNNRWALYSSFECSVDNICLIAVWDKKNQAPKDRDDRDVRQVRHMVNLANKMGVKTERINPLKVLAAEAAQRSAERLKDLVKDPKPGKDPKPEKTGS